MIDTNNPHRPRYHGYTIDTLDNLQYKELEPLNDDDEYYSPPISCSYILPKDIVGRNDGLSIMSYNIRSYDTNFDSLSAEISNLTSAYDILGFCETHFTDATESLSKIKGFEMYTTNISSSVGGVCLFVRENLNCKLRNDLKIAKEHIEMVFVECYIQNKPLVIGMLYRRPGTSVDKFTEDLVITLNKINQRCILMGDFNLNLLNEENSNDVQNLVNIMKQFSYNNVITKPTRVSKFSATLIDHIWVNFELTSHCNSQIIFSGVTDHFPIILNHKKLSAPSVKRTISYRKVGENFDEMFSDKLINADFTEVLETNNVEQAFSNFNDILFKLYDETYPLVTRTIKCNDQNNAWITPGILQSIKTKNKLYKKFVRKPITYGQIYRTYRNNLTKIIKASKNAYYRVKFSNVKGNIKETWKVINGMLGKNVSNLNAIVKINSKLSTDPQVISNGFNEYFSNIATNVTNSLPESDVTFDHYLPPANTPGIIWEPVSEPEMKRIVSKCNATKPGPDNIPMRIIKNNINILCPVLTALTNKSLTSGIFPDIHKIGKIIPLFKNKDKYEISNYRPICLLNAMGKLLEKVVSTRIINHLEEKNLLASNQFAYRKGKGTDLANLNFIKNVLNNFDENNYTIAVFLDLTKAFDCVSHQILLKKLKYYGIIGRAHDWLASYLCNRRQFVSVNGKKSLENSINIGVPQGSILGPLMFLIYINDINNAILSGDLSLFADDANYYNSGKDCYQVIKTVNDNLKLLSKWFLANKLSLNHIKTEAMLFCRRIMYYPMPPVIIDDIPLSYSSKFKFLGLIIDNKLNWKHHINHVRAKLSSACGIFYKLRNKLSSFIAKLLYYSIAYPYINYGCIVWCSAYNTSLESLCTIQRKLIRLMCKRDRRANTSILFHEMKLLKIHDVFKLNTLLFVFKSVNNIIDSPIVFTERQLGAYNLRTRPQLLVPNYTSMQSERFIHVRGVRVWNELQESVRNSLTIYSFKYEFKR